MDKAGNPGTSRRQTPKMVSAIKYKKDGKLVIEASSKLLFDSRRKERLSDTGKEVMNEIEDYIKMTNKFPVQVRVYSEDEGLAKDQVETIQRRFEQVLKVPKNSFEMRAFREMSAPRNYRIVFVISG